MSAFIEVRSHRTNRTIIINTAAIERVSNEGTFRRITFRGGTGAAEAEQLDVVEEYGDLRQLLKAFNA